jgi:ATP-dependent DNA helicase RecG
MNSEKLVAELLKQKPSNQLDFMETARKENIGKVICSFLNNEGGQLLIGVSKNRQPKHIRNAAKIAKDIEHYLVEEIVPEAAVMVSVEAIGKKNIILIKVWSGSKQPYVFLGTIFYRRHSDTVPASSKEISSLIHNRQETESSWERQPSLAIEENDLDQEEIRITMEKALADGKIKEVKKDPIEFLSYYGLYLNGHFTNAAVVLFAKNPAKFLPQVRVRVSFYLKERAVIDLLMIAF